MFSPQFFKTSLGNVRLRTQRELLQCANTLLHFSTAHGLINVSSHAAASRFAILTFPQCSWTRGTAAAMQMSSLRALTRWPVCTLQKHFVSSSRFLSPITSPLRYSPRYTLFPCLHDALDKVSRSYDRLPRSCSDRVQDH